MRFSLVCLAFGSIHLRMGAPMHMDTSFGRPRDPVMDQVADILKGILSNLTKHRSLVAIADTVSKSKDLSAEQKAMVLDDLERQVKKLNSGGESFALDAYLAEHPTEKDAPKRFKESLVTVVSALKSQ